MRLPGQTARAAPAAPVKHISDHFHAGICVCPCPACTDHPGEGVTRCVCLHCPEDLCGARAGVVASAGGVEVAR